VTTAVTVTAKFESIAGIGWPWESRPGP
jgi:hypothetical protein